MSTRRARLTLAVMLLVAEVALFMTGDWFAGRVRGSTALVYTPLAIVGIALLALVAQSSRR